MYYPIDQRRQRQDIREFEQSIGIWIEKGKVTQDESLPVAMKAVMARFQVLGYERKSFPSMFQALSAEAKGLLTWGQWRIAGSRILDVSAALTRALHLSDCGNVIISDIIPEIAPGASEDFYVRFGNVHEIVFSGHALEERVSFEGAYVFINAHSIRVVLCGSMPAQTPAHERWRERYDLHIPSSLFSLPVRAAVEEALALDLKDLVRARATVNSEASRTLIDQCSDWMKANHASWCEAVFLIANLLAWLKHLPEDFEDGWPDGAPVRLVEQLKSGTAREQARARSKLWSTGFAPIKRVGVRFEREFQIERTVSQHIRRGHWRNQAHGAGFSLRKLIWILPMIVGREKGEEQ